MTLVTTCPNCDTSFRVVADQLKLRRGLVRCGHCRTVFSGLERLRRLEGESDEAGAASRAPPPPGIAPPGIAPPEAAVPEATVPEAATQRPELPETAPSEAVPGDTMPPLGVAEQEVEAGPEDYAPWRAGDASWRPDDTRDDRYGPDDESPMTLAVDYPETLPADFAPALPARRSEARPAGFAVPESGEHDARWPESASASAEDASARPAGAGASLAHHERDSSPSSLFRTPPARRAAGQRDGDAPERAMLHEDDPRLAEELEAVVQELEAWDDGESAIDYFSAERQRRGFIGRNGGWKLLAASALVLLLGLQSVFANRDWLAARFPALEPMIATLGAPFGLEIALPRALGSLAIESFELQAAGRPGLFSVSAIVRNDASHAVRWPSMLLTLTDPGNRVLLRKAIDPADYLPPTAVEAGLRPRSERPVRLALEADDVEPAGYSVALFYR